MIFALSLVAVYAQSGSEAQTSKWTVDDVIMSESASGFQVSPDGRWTVWVKNIADKEKDHRISNLMLSSLTEKREIELTRGSENSISPKWSPDGQLIAFITTRPNPKAKPDPAATPDEEPKPQLWLIYPFGGEAWPLTEFSRGVTSFEWADPDTIIFAAQEEPTFYENAIKEKKDTSLVVEDEQHAPPVRLFKITVKDKKFTRITDNVDRIQYFSLSPDGTKAVTIHDRSLRYIYDNRIKPLVFLYDLAKGDRKQIFSEAKFNVRDAEWARDGKGFYIINDYTTHPEYLMATVSHLYYYDLASGSPSQVDLQWENGLAAEVDATENGFVTLLANGASHKAARYIREGAVWRREWITGDHSQNIFGLELGQDNKTLLYSYSTASTPSQWFRSKLEGGRIDSVAQLTDINQHFKKKTIAKSEVIRWKGALDEEVEGILLYPHNYEPGKRYALVVMTHGGPAGADFDEWDESWAYAPNMMCERGAFVLKTNYHGSSNYGLKFVESIANGKYYDLEVPDIEKGVDHLIEKGMVDPNKLGAMGWSNGSILTIALTIHSTRYKVAGAGAGDVEWTSDWASAHFGAAFDNYYLGKSPLEDPQIYMKKSPFYKLDRVRTPTIIFFGTEDTNVPTQQGWMHYRALQQLGKTDVRFILFPGEPHSLKKLVHQRRKLEEELAWFDKYLFKTLKPEDESLKPDSPLAIALKLKSVKNDQGRYGVIEEDALTPETVKYNELEISRFEITRAQYAQFDKNYKIEQGKENYPANNITFEQARAYCEWLSRATKQTYRLPSETEAEKIYNTPAAAENTLDYWAGYTVNPDDAARLQQKIAALGSKESLLKEVGSFKGAGMDEMVFDLGGNVAEWTVAQDGTGRLVGGSADTPADSKMRARNAAPEYRGFRVVKGAPAVK